MKKAVLVIVVVLALIVAGAIYLQRSERPGEPEGEGVGEVATPEEQLAPGETALESAGEVTHLIPEAWTERKQAALELAVESPVYWQEEVWTEDAARLRLALTDGSVLNLGSNVHLKIVEHELKSARSEFLLTFGQLRAEVTYQPEKRFEVRTNTAVIGVMGTQFYVEALAEMTIVICFEGVVRVRNVRDDIAGEVLLRAGEKSVIYKDRPPTPAELVPPEEMVEVAAETSATLPPPTERAEGLTRPSPPATAAVPTTEAAGTPGFAVLTVTDDTFEKEVLQSGLPILVDFWAAWAAPSKALAPTMESVAQQYRGKLLVARVNVEENPESARRCRIQAVPTLVLFKDGNEMGRVAGAVARASIDTLLQNNGISGQ